MTSKGTPPLAGFCYTKRTMVQSIEQPTLETDTLQEDVKVVEQKPSVDSVYESKVSLGKEIQELKQKIKELSEGKARVVSLQKNYGVPEEGLTDTDLATLRYSEVELKERLSKLIEQHKSKKPSIRKLLRRAVAFLSL